jgi:hypothetical protein
VPQKTERITATQRVAFLLEKTSRKTPAKEPQTEELQTEKLQAKNFSRKTFRRKQ